MQDTPASSASAPLVGQLIAERYRVEELLGEGGMGAVYRATHVQLQKPVALKVLHSHMTQVDEAVARFEREAVASARIEHANVVNATDFGRLPDGSFFLVLEYVAGKSLRDVILEGPLPERRALHITRQIAQALIAAHAQGIIHRDLKPDNVMLLDKDGDPDFAKVLDFGIAKVRTGSDGKTPTLTRFGTVFGTPQYMAPEQAAGRNVDARADLYAVGVILYEMLSGKPPFDADDLLVLLTQQMTQEPPPLPRWISNSTAALTLRLMEKDAADRVQSASDLLAALSGQSIARSGVRPRLPASLTRFASRLSTGNWRSSGTNKPLLVGLGALLVLLAVYFLLPSPSAPPEIKPDLPLAEQIPPDASELLEKALKGDKQALAELEELSQEEPSSTHFLALGRAKKASSDLKGALAAYQAAVKSDAAAAHDSSLLSDLRQLAVDDSIYEQVMAFAAKDLGADGVDLLVDVWLSEQGATVPAKRAKKFLEDPELRKRASQAALIAIDLRESNSCSSHKELMPRAIQFADERSMIPLRRFTVRRGCGFLSLSDCYGCLRSNNDLTDALKAAQARPAPKFTPDLSAATAASAKPAISATPASAKPKAP